MNAPAAVPAWERYKPALASLKPGCGEEETRYRCGLMLMRDQALKLTRDDSTGFMRMIWLNASEAAIAPMSLEQTKDVWGLLGQIFAAARKVAQVSDDLARGDDARG